MRARKRNHIVSLVLAGALLWQGCAKERASAQEPTATSSPSTQEAETPAIVSGEPGDVVPLAPESPSEELPSGQNEVSDVVDAVDDDIHDHDGDDADDGDGEVDSISETDVSAPGTLSESGPLSPEERALLTASPEDPPTEELLGVSVEFEGRHYVYGDEYNLHLFQPVIDGLGGGYVGVGADQAYILMGWQRPTIAWLIDYDPWVVALHAAYLTFFKAAATPAEFRRYWSKEHREAGLELLRAELADHPRGDLAIELYGRYAAGTGLRLARVVNDFEARGVPSVFHTQELYDGVRTRILEGRVRALSANLLDDEGLIGVANTARQLGVPIRVLYLSNAEEYWEYPEQYRTNILAMPFDAKSLVLRTLSTWSRNKDYQYAIQSGQSYAGWLTRRWVLKVSYMVQRQPVGEPIIPPDGGDPIYPETPLIVTELDIATAEEARRRRRERKKAARKRRRAD